MPQKHLRLQKAARDVVFMAKANFQHRSLDGHFDSEEVPDAAVFPEDAHPLAGSRGFSSSLTTIRDAGGKQTGSGPASA